MKENRGIISLTTGLKISWNKYSQGSKSKENLRTLKKETAEDGKTHAHGLVRLILQNSHPSKYNLQIQCDPHQNPNAILYRK